MKKKKLKKKIKNIERELEVLISDQKEQLSKQHINRNPIWCIFGNPYLPEDVKD